MNIGEMWRQLLRYLDLGESGMEVWQIQEAIAKAVANTRVKTLTGQTLIYGNTMIVSLSPEAYEVVRPVERPVVNELQEHLPKRLQEVGLILNGAPLRIALVVDPGLQGREVKVGASERDVTPDEHGRASREPDPDVTPDDASQVSVVLVGPKPREWQVRGDRRLLIGRRPKQPGTVHTDVEIDNPTLSRLHAGLQAVRLPDGDKGLEVTDLESQNGTFVDGRRVDSNRPVHVRHGQVIRLGGKSGVNLRVSVAGVDPDATEPYDPRKQF